MLENGGQNYFKKEMLMKKIKSFPDWEIPITYIACWYKTLYQVDAVV